MADANIYLEDDQVRLSSDADVDGDLEAASIVADESVELPSGVPVYQGSIDPADGKLTHRFVANRPGIGCSPGLFVGDEESQAFAVHGDLKTAVVGGYTTTNVPFWIDDDFEFTDPAMDAIAEMLNLFVEENDLAEDETIPETVLTGLIRALVPVEYFDVAGDRLAEVTRQSESDSDVATLESLSGVGSRRAETLRAAGYDSPTDIDRATVDELTSVHGIGSVTARSLKEATTSVSTRRERIEFDDVEGLDDRVITHLRRGGFESPTDLFDVDRDELAERARLPPEVATRVLKQISSLDTSHPETEPVDPDPPSSPEEVLAHEFTERTSRITTRQLQDAEWFTDGVSEVMRRGLERGTLDFVEEPPERLPREYDDLEQYADREFDFDFGETYDPDDEGPPFDVPFVPEPVPIDIDPQLGGTLLVKDADTTVTAAIGGSEKSLLLGPDVVTDVDSNREGEVAPDRDGARCVLDGSEGRLRLGDNDAAGELALRNGSGTSTVELAASDGNDDARLTFRDETGEPAATVTYSDGSVTFGSGNDNDPRLQWNPGDGTFAVDGDGGSLTFDAADGSLSIDGDLTVSGDVSCEGEIESDDEE